MATRQKTNLPVNCQQQLLAEAENIAARVSAPTGDRIRMTKTGFVLPDGTETDTINAVIVEFVSTNSLFETVYDPNNPQPPGCFAVGFEPNSLKPVAASPNKQCDSCTECPMNVFGTATTGRGKACKNSRLLALMSADAAENDSPLWTYSVPPTGLPYFDRYVNTLASKHRTVPVGVVTEITLEDCGTYLSPRFRIVRPLSPKELAPYMESREEAKQRLFAEPDFSQYTPAKRAPAKRATARR